MKLKKALILGVVMTMLLGTATTVNAAGFGRSYTAPKGTPTIDAKVDDVWKTAAWTNVDKPFDGTRDTTSELRIKVLWDEQKLYFLAEVYDTHKNKRNDLVEVYIDQNNDKASKYGPDDTQTRFYVHQLGVVKGDASVAGTNSQANAPSAIRTISKNLYLVEGALNWPTGQAPSVGTQMGVEFMYNDGDMYTPWVDSYRWNADTAKGDEPPYVSTSAFGTLILGDVGTALPDNTYIANEKMTKVFSGETDDKAPTDKAPTDKAPTDKTPTDNKDTSNKDTSNKDTSNKDTSNKDTANKDTANKDTANKDTANKDTANKDDANKDTANKEDADKVKDDNKAENSDQDVNANNDVEEEKGGLNIKTVIILVALGIIAIAIVVILLSGKKKDVTAE